MRDWVDLLADGGSATGLPGTDESVAAVRCRIGGHEVVLVWCRFEVAAGTLSVAAGERFVAALDTAVADGLPVVAVANSGGARMQEGSRGFVQMIAATAAVARLRAAGLGFLVYLADPTTGGVFASWASSGHVSYAEPGATIGFTGPRVAAALGEPIEPADVQTAEGLLESGLVDDVVARDGLRDRVVEFLSVLAPATPTPAASPPSASDGLRGWAAVVETRRVDRPRVLDELVARCTDVVELRGGRDGGRTDAVFAALCRLDGVPAVVVGHRPGARPTVSDLRLARRAVVVATDLRLPVVTLIDTPGAAVSAAQEQAGLAGQIARSIAALGAATVPSLAVIAGQGCGGAAMAWLAADRVVAASDSWLAPISPEAASIIVHRDAQHADALADEQQVGAVQLREQGIVDDVFDRDRLVDEIVAFVTAAALGAG